MRSASKGRTKVHFVMPFFLNNRHEGLWGEAIAYGGGPEELSKGLAPNDNNKFLGQFVCSFPNPCEGPWLTAALTRDSQYYVIEHFLFGWYWERQPLSLPSINMCIASLRFLVTSTVQAVIRSTGRSVT